MGALVVVKNVLDDARWGYSCPGFPTVKIGDPDTWPFPAGNLATYRAGRVFRSRAVAQGTQAWGQMPQLTTGIDTVALVNHNLPAGSLVWMGYSISAFSHISALTWLGMPDVSGPGSLVYRLPKPLTARTLALWVVRIGSGVGKPAAAPQVGEFYAGAGEALPGEFQWGSEDGEDWINAGGESEYGVPYRYALSSRRVFSGQLQNAMPLEDANRVRSIRRRLRGSAHPFLFIPDATGHEAVIGRLAGDSYRAKQILPGKVAALDFTVLEDPYGEDGA